MKVLQILMLILVVFFSLNNVVGQKKSDDSVALNGTIKIGATFFSSGKINTKEKIINGAIIILFDEKGKEYSAKTNEIGKYQINLPIGKYRIYATASSDCWMCAEYYNNDFLITNKRKIKLNIVLQFYGEG